uniref:HMG-box containing 4 n=1 Tax=Lynx canadensis TaxID=61383 RepID=A0A667GY41_LYNCA
MRSALRQERESPSRAGACALGSTEAPWPLALFSPSPRWRRSAALRRDPGEPSEDCFDGDHSSEDTGLAAGRSQREKKRSYKDFLREEEEIAAQVRNSSKKKLKDSELYFLGTDTHKKKRKHSSDDYYHGGEEGRGSRWDEHITGSWSRGRGKGSRCC